MWRIYTRIVQNLMWGISGVTVMDKDKTAGVRGQTGERQKYSLLKGRDVNIKH